mgnify:FL=1
MALQLYIKQSFWYILKLILSYLFFLIGGVYLLKLLFRNKKALIILNYHNFSRYNNYKIKRGNILETDYANNFEKQIRFLKNHFSFCYPEEFFYGNCNNGINLLITFDDGYKDNFDIACPILKKYEVSAIFFIATKALLDKDFLIHDKVRYLIQIGVVDKQYGLVPALLNKGGGNYTESFINEIEYKFKAYKPNQRLMLNAKELVEISNMGFKIGNHTHHHAGLSFLKYDEQIANILKCNDIIQKLTSKKVDHLAFPNGLYNQETINIVKRIGIRFSYTIVGGINYPDDNPLVLKRIGVNASDSIPVLITKLVTYLTIKRNKRN